MSVQDYAIQDLRSTNEAGLNSGATIPNFVRAGAGARTPGEVAGFAGAGQPGPARGVAT